MDVRWHINSEILQTIQHSAKALSQRHCSQHVNLCKSLHQVQRQVNLTVAAIHGDCNDTLHKLVQVLRVAECSH